MTETVKDWLDCIPAAWENDECLPFPFCVANNGYGQFRSGSRQYLAHRYVCSKFSGEQVSPNMHAAHSCGNKTCVNPRHIRWASRSENENDKKVHGRDNSGERHGMSKLTPAQVLAIRNADGFQKDIARQFGICRQTVSDIKRGLRWTHLS